MHHLDNTPFSWIGPDASEGPLPAICYLALSDRETLLQDPYNQPAMHAIEKYHLRVFSLSLPSHGPNLPPQHAITRWKDAYLEGKDLLTPCLDALPSLLDALFQSGLVLAGKLGLMSLSRGAFFTLHAAAKKPHITSIVSFAPMLNLRLIKEFAPLFPSPTLERLSLEHLIDSLATKTIRCYIGNRDTRVMTKEAFRFNQMLVEEAHKKQVRTIPIELILFPSIGQDGHGTPLKIFCQGAEWIAEQLGAKRKYET